MPFRELKSSVSQCGSCGAPVDLDLAIRSKVSGLPICRSCEAAELHSERTPIVGERLAYAALALAAFGLAPFFGPFRVLYLASPLLGVGAILAGTKARGYLRELSPESMRAPKRRTAGILAAIAVLGGTIAAIMFIGTVAFDCTSCLIPR